MANPVYEVLLTKERLEAPKKIVDPSAALPPSQAYGAASRTSLGVGAVVDFWGVVRELEDGREIEGIEYEAHSIMAKHQLEKIVEQATADFALDAVVIHHRIGFVPASESSLFVRVAARHRAAAFAANKWIVDALKKTVPIWKRPKFKMDNQRSAAHCEAATWR